MYPLGEAGTGARCKPEAPWWVGSLLPSSHGFQWWDSGHQACTASTFTHFAEPSCQPSPGINETPPKVANITNQFISFTHKKQENNCLKEIHQVHIKTDTWEEWLCFCVSSSLLSHQLAVEAGAGRQWKPEGRPDSAGTWVLRRGLESGQQPQESIWSSLVGYV